MIKSIKQSSCSIVLMCLWLVLMQQVDSGAGQPQSQAVAAPQRGANELQPKKTSNGTTTINVYPSKVGANATAEPLDTAPTITSVHHQVWTSSSSGSLNELSPEVISKLRNDVPFLAAYALRPRLVGAAAATGGSPGQLVAAVPAESSSSSSSSVGSLDSGAGSSPQLARQSLLPRLGDFSELKVETSSLSKSEHRHKRRTTLKRRPDEQDGQVGGSTRSAEQRRPARTSRSSGGRSSKGHRRRSAKKASGRLVAGNTNRRARLSSKQAKRARFLQDGKDEQAPGANKIDNHSTEGEVKGGARSPANKRPFYAGRGEAADKQAPTTTTTGGPEPAAGNDVEEGPESAADDEQIEPKRVGDDDVDEEGDTVLVEPKSDGVDDDPPLPTDGEPETGGDSGQPADGSAANGVDDMEEERRGRRVNRQKPNQTPDRGDDSTGQSTAGGAGIGATTGGGPGGSNAQGDSDRPRQGSEVKFADDEDQDDKDDERKPTGGGRADDEPARAPKEAGSGGRDDEPDERDFGRRQKPQGPNGSGDDDEDGDDDEKVKPETGSRRGPDKPNSNANDDRDDDLDYRDELDEQSRRKAARPGGVGADKTGAKGPADGGHVDEVGDADDRPGKGSKAAKDGESTRATGDDCAHDDGSYKHHDEKYHDDHHQTIDWLRGSIPGEPGDDYPILSRVNSTNFQCRQQKYPGYYADVDTRCQVFHICQADGRQDSFLCPNGTIFSQKTLVCVWWNGFDCEDAPKLYHLNALLYKERPTHEASPIESPQSAALPDANEHSGASLRPHGGSKQTAYLKPKGMMHVAGEGGALDGARADADEDMSIDSLIRAMKRRPAEGMAELSPDDEATIQRKSTGALEESAPSRLRAKSIPRRKRRASTRQAPPKLKSRRVSRNSRRRKLRHGIKPKRRA